MALLAVVCACLEALVGDGGLLLDQAPDAGLLAYLQVSGAGAGGAGARPRACVAGRGRELGCEMVMVVMVVRRLQLVRSGPQGPGRCQPSRSGPLHGV